MKRWRPLAFGLGAYVLALIIIAPATLVDAGLQRASDGRLRLAEALGTLWSGSGQIEIRDSSGRTGIAKSLVWRIVPTSLLRGHLVCEIGLDQTTRRFPVTITFSGIELANADIRLPAAALGLASPQLGVLELTGDMQLQIPRLAIARDRVQGNATLQWRAASSALSPVSPLGDFELRIEGEGSAVRATLLTLQGPLQLEGKGLWSRGSSLTFQATARVPPQHQQQLAPLLRLIAVERGNGSFDLKLQ